MTADNWYLNCAIQVIYCASILYSFLLLEDGASVHLVSPVAERAALLSVSYNSVSAALAPGGTPSCWGTAPFSRV